MKFLGLILGYKRVKKLSIAKCYRKFHLTEKIADFLRKKHFFR